MDLVIDIGNTRFKAAAFSDAQLEKKYSFSSAVELKAFLEHQTFDQAILSSVSFDGNEVSGWINAKKKFLLTHLLPLPVQNKYKTPGTLGVDRLAAVCGAASLFPQSDCLVIDAGTCITFDFIDAEQNYLGGAISPGIAMRFEAMHTFTKRLPLVAPTDAEKLIGDSTESCMRSGVINGILAEVEGIIGKYMSVYPDLRVVLCGGDTRFFENNLKPTIFAAPDLVLSGLNRILLYNAAL